MGTVVMSRKPVRGHPGITLREWGQTKRYDASYRGPDGKERCRTFRNLGPAATWLRDQRAAADRGTWIDPRHSMETLESFYQSWRAKAQANGKPTERTLLAYDEIFRLYIEPRLGQRRLASIARADVESVVTVASVVSAWRAQDALKVVRRVLQAAVDAELIVRNPASRILAPKIEQSEPRVLEPEEFSRLLEHVPDRYQALVMTAVYGGLRWSELVGLKVARLDLPRNRIYVAEAIRESGRLIAGDVKTKRSRRWVTLPDFVTFALAEHLRIFGPGDDGTVFTSPNGWPLRRQNFARRVWRPCVKAAGLEGFPFRNLRHTSATWALAKGNSPTLVAFRLGHASTRMIEAHYGSLLESLDAAIAESLAGYSRDGWKASGQRLQTL